MNNDDKNLTTKNDTKKNNEIKENKVTQKKLDKDAIINTPKEGKDGVSIMPFDDESLKTFSLKKMNFKDMTGSQKNTLIVLCIFSVLILLALLLPVFSKMFGGINIGNLHFLPTEEKEKEEDSSFANEGDYIILGNNTTITVEGVKFYNFTKGNNYQLMYNYVSTKEIESVSELKLYVEFYTNTKSLISRYAFANESNTLKEKETGLNTIRMSANNFNKAYFVRVRIITDAIIEELPPEQRPQDPNNPNIPGGPGDDGNGGGGGSNPTDPNDPNNPGDGDKVDKTKLMTCTSNTIDGSLKITKTFKATFENDEIIKYNVDWKIASLITDVPKNYAKHYKEMLNLYKDMMISVGVTASIENSGLSATLTYETDYKKYQNIEIEKEDYHLYDPDLLEEYLAEKHPYDLEIKRKSTRESAKEQMEAKEWICD